MSEFDAPQLRQAMRAYIDAADALDLAGQDVTTDKARDILDHADTKALAALALRRHLEAAGWVAPRMPAPANGAD
jgi:hypothetical protein